MLRCGVTASASRTACITAVLLFLAALAPAESIVIASYNLRNYLSADQPVDAQGSAEAPKPPEEIAAVVRIIRAIRPDVIGLMEIGGEDMLQDLQSRLAAAGIDLPHSEWVKGADSARHLALLSRFPIIARNSLDDVPFALQGSRQRMARGILDVTIRTGHAHDLRLVGAHLKSQRPIPEFDERELRAKEAWLLRQHLDGILTDSPQANVLLFGDLNDTKNEYPIKLLAGTPGSPGRLRELPLEDRHGQRWTHFWAAADSYSRLDYFFVSNHLWPLIDQDASGISNEPAWNQASDHRAIFTKINFLK